MGGKQAREVRGESKRRLLGVVYFDSTSNSPVLINDFDEGSDSLPGDRERREGGQSGSGTWFIWSRARGKRERER